ncbi:MAG: hypothetical protein DRJ03_31460 [Chloroflexi bacterium]|nr:MAG: hypothetical protein DRJ03_31460 [Chloroflexota bacterium]
MFAPNNQHFQISMFGSINSLPENLQKRLEESWADDFYSKYFVRMDEKPFAVLYSDEPSRPNIPVNVLVGLETLKSGQQFPLWEKSQIVAAISQLRRTLYAAKYLNRASNSRYGRKVRS